MDRPFTGWTVLAIALGLYGSLYAAIWVFKYFWSIV